jgi:hypothetical protein
MRSRGVCSDDDDDDDDACQCVMSKRHYVLRSRTPPSERRPDTCDSSKDDSHDPVIIEIDVILSDTTFRCIPSIDNPLGVMNHI